MRCFDDPDIAHVTGGVDPGRDVEIINTELALADEEAVDRALERYGRRGRAGDKDALAVATVLERVRDHLDEGKPARSLGLKPD